MGCIVSSTLKEFSIEENEKWLDAKENSDDPLLVTCEVLDESDRNKKLVIMDMNDILHGHKSIQMGSEFPDRTPEETKRREMKENGIFKKSL